MPEVSLQELQGGKPTPVPLAPLLAGRRVVLFGLPGAFTPTCSRAHVPGFIDALPSFIAEGIGAVICIAVNDAWVMDAWARYTGGQAAGIRFLADPAGDLTEALGLRMDSPETGLIGRMKRNAMLTDDGIVEIFNLEEQRGVCTLTSAANLLAAL